MEQIFQKKICGRDLIVKAGHLAQFANGSVWMQYGDTVVMCTATAATEPKDGIDFFPLSVDYEEKMYSIGRFPGGFLRREGRPTEKAVLVARAIDRPMRPLFPKDLRNAVSINCTVFSVDPTCAPDILAMNGASLATAISDIPWDGPTATVRVGLIDDNFIINPTEDEQEISDLELTLAGTTDRIVMIEAGANEVPDDIMIEAIKKGHDVIKELCSFFKEIIEVLGKPKFTYTSVSLPEEVIALFDEFYDQMKDAVCVKSKDERDLRVAEVKLSFSNRLESTNPDLLSYVGEAIYQLEKKVVRHLLFVDHVRVDARRLDEIRPLSCGIDVVPRVHGSSLFQRGSTQVLNMCTLGPMSDAQKLDGLDQQTEKRYMHHYNFPGFSVGEAKPSRSPGRREIGHGALAERSLIPVLPSLDEFPYAIRTVSEILMSNGSTSQGSVCASTLSLMAAGVPIKRPVAGISCGLITNGEDINDHLVFMDIQGIEDFFGDMDFKVAGTTKGITSIQVDIKVKGLSLEIIEKAFDMTKKGRLQIINDVMMPCIDRPRTELSKYAPKIVQTIIPIDKISEVIGKGGKTINKIIEETGAQIDIEEDGRVMVYCADQEMGKRTIEIIENIVKDPVVGEVYDGVVTRIINFGAFVEFLPGKEGMVHVSKIDWSRVSEVEDVLSVGDQVKVKIIEIDPQGRINLSMRDCKEKPADYVQPQERNNRYSSDRSDRFNRSRFNRGQRREKRRDDRNGSAPRGHFR